MYGSATSFFEVYNIIEHRWLKREADNTRGVFPLDKIICSLEYPVVLEWTGPRKRALVGCLLAISYVCGHMTLALLAYGIRHWRFLQIATAVPQLPLLVIYLLRVAPESPRWLLSLGHVSEADVIIRRAVRANKVSLPNSYFTITSIYSNKKVEEKKEVPYTERKYDFSDLFRTSKLRATTCIMFVNWFTLSLCYYGLSLFSTDLAGNDYVSFFLSGLVEIPGIILGSYIINRWGRSKSIALFIITSGLSCLLCPFPPKNVQYIATALSLVGKLGATAAYWSTFLHVAELFPTVVRNMGICLVAMAARTSSILLPFTRLLSDVWQPFPYVIIGASTALTGSLMFLVPETLNRPLPATIEEFKELHKRRRNSFDKSSIKAVPKKMECRWAIPESYGICDV
ncbi:organic cation transporter protein-like isoform X2 [Ptychodera flava]|uniref:organic cation transporter protein-like isoform X2 n=1 Tax=Ptychodera flava TaxID=63121 RepID=UPI00396AA108